MSVDTPVRGFLYLTTDPEKPGILRIGKSADPPDASPGQADTTPEGSTAAPAVRCCALFEDVGEAEKWARRRLARQHYKEDCFKVDLKAAVDVIEGLGLQFERVYVEEGLLRRSGGEVSVPDWEITHSVSDSDNDQAAAPDHGHAVQTGSGRRTHFLIVSSVLGIALIALWILVPGRLADAPVEEMPALSGEAGLVWTSCLLGQFLEPGGCVGEALRLDWDAARVYIEERLGSGWRLPTRNELDRVLEARCGDGPCVAQTAAHRLLWTGMSIKDANGILVLERSTGDGMYVHRTMVLPFVAVKGEQE